MVKAMLVSFHVRYNLLHIWSSFIETPAHLTSKQYFQILFDNAHFIINESQSLKPDTHDNRVHPPSLWLLSSALPDAHHYDPEHPPIRALLQALDVQLAEQEALVMCSVCWWLRDCRAALGWSGPGPPRRLSCLFGAWSAPWFGPVPSSRPFGTGRLLW